ncbi:hypothetical protein C1645_826140 [Glomus cerebriforme]|uniref:Uncharacterized protein n=1 Tax=Glomus cerebriforme TaxID=658196 RepID=A0A397SR10_9GLOM|nr:hypothetical protein C1645_826140 [Glomus cerebriforme]
MGSYGKCQGCGCGCGCNCSNTQQVPQVLQVPQIPLQASNTPYQTMDTLTTLSNIGYEIQNFDHTEINNFFDLQIYNNQINQINHYPNNGNFHDTNSLNNVHTANEINRGRNKRKNKINARPYNIGVASNKYAKKKRATSFIVHCLPYGVLTPKIPRRIVTLRNAGLVRSFTCLDDDRIKEKLEGLFPCLKNRNWVFFRCKSTSDLEIADEPMNIDALKSIAGFRKKIYLGTIDGSI